VLPKKSWEQEAARKADERAVPLEEKKRPPVVDQTPTMRKKL
jgi:hypothetical protein